MRTVALNLNCLEHLKSCRCQKVSKVPASVQGAMVEQATMLPQLLDGVGKPSAARPHCKGCHDKHWRTHCAMQSATGGQATTLPQLLHAFGKPSASPDLEAAAAGCAAQRLGLLSEQRARLRFGCPAATADAENEGVGAATRADGR